VLGTWKLENPTVAFEINMQKIIALKRVQEASE